MAYLATVHVALTYHPNFENKIAKLDCMLKCVFALSLFFKIERNSSSLMVANRGFPSFVTTAMTVYNIILVVFLS